jgi:FAS-associated factor 2
VPQQQPAGGPPAPSAAGRGSARQQQQQQQQHAGGGGGLLALPMRLLVSGIRAMAAVVRLTMHIAAAVGDRVLPASIMRSARGEAGAFCSARSACVLHATTSAAMLIPVDN